MPRPLIEINPEKEILKKIRVAEAALNITPHANIRDACLKELEKLYKELQEIRNTNLKN